MNRLIKTVANELKHKQINQNISKFIRKGQADKNTDRSIKTR